MVQFFSQNNKLINSHGQLNALSGLVIYKKEEDILMDIRQKFLPRTLVKFNDIICNQFANLENRYISEKRL